MTLTAEFYDLINSVENFGKLPNDDPLVIRVRELAKSQDGNKHTVARKKIEKRVHTAHKVLHETTAFNLTEARYLYLIQRGVEKKDIARKLACTIEVLSGWVKEKGLLKKDQTTYNLMIDEECIGVYDSLSDMSIVLEVTASYASKIFRLKRIMKDGSRIELFHKFIPTLEDLKGHSKQDTYKYWYDNRLQKQAGVMA